MKFKKYLSLFTLTCGTLMAIQNQSAEATPVAPAPKPEAIVISDAPFYDYGVQAIGSTTLHTFTVKNKSASTVNLQSTSLPPPFSYPGGVFPGTNGTCSTSLAPSQSCTVVVQFLPQVPGSFVASLDIWYSPVAIVSSNADDVESATSSGPPHGGTRPSLARRTIKGSSVLYGLLAVSDAPAYDFGEVILGQTVQHTFTLTNPGPSPIFKITPTITAINGGDFAFVGGSYPGTGGTCGDLIQPKSSCTITIEFTPNIEGPISATLSFLYKSHGGLYITEQLLTGTGINAPLVLSGETESTCALFANGLIKCWGGNSVGQLGLGDTLNRGDAVGEMGVNLPYVDLGTGRTVQQIFSGNGNHCAILDNNDLKCWGANQAGQLGLGDTLTRGDQPGEMGDNLPAIDLGTGLYATKVALSDVSMCAILNNNKIKCWGGNSVGQLGLGDTVTRGDQPGEMGDNLPFVDLGDDTDGSSYEAIDLVGMFESFCAVLKSGNMKCWGWNSAGQLGINDTVDRGSLPGQMGNNLPFLNFGVGLTVKQAVGSNNSGCALLSNDQVRCWGANTVGQLGIGNTIDQADSPLRPLSAVPFVDFGTGLTVVSLHYAVYANNTCALFSNGRVKCWGFNSNGQLGLGDTLNRGDDPGEMGNNLPFVDVGTNLTVRQMTQLAASACAILNTYEVKCWGLNSVGQLGLGDTFDRGDAPGEMGDNLPFVILL